MMPRFLFSVAALGWALTLGSLPAAEKPELHWLSESQQAALVAAVPPPPAPGSVEDKADLAGSVAAEKARTAEAIAEAKLDEHFSVELFQSAYAADITAGEHPLFAQFIKDLGETTHSVNLMAKNKYQRPRPYVGHPEVIHALFPAREFSYPSGHAMGAYAFALVLAEIFPDRRQALLDRAAAISQSRVDAGVHYASDIREGQALGRATVAALLANADFQARLVAVRKELGRSS